KVISAASDFGVEITFSNEIYLKNGNYEKIILDYRMKEKYNGNNSKKTYMEWRENSLAGKQNSGNHSG
ncbi:MAG TPA: hypothetical protein PLP87_03040, partial [Clostridiales bacterium]|nr:hypothetical protein [Clostridiales bacterium]